ncbi:MAG: RNA polymerase sigma factor [Planctomycetes bacterium]|nr:RNA polymerase sigma factor [Planctomycetota bacterium]
MRTEPLGADAFTAAFAQHGRALWVLAAAWVGRGEAQDLVQEAARIAWQRRERFVVGTDFGAWVAQIVRHEGANWRRRRRPHLGVEFAEPVAPAPNPASTPIDAIDWPAELARPLQQLAPEARASLLLHVIAGLSFAEIATMLERNENTVTSLARRARSALREALTTTDPVVAPKLAKEPR